MTLAQFGSYLGGFVALAVLIYTMTSGRFREAMELQSAAMREADHLRGRIEEVRRQRDEAEAELEREQTRTERKDARIAQLEARVTQLTQQLSGLETKERALRKLAKERGATDEEIERASA